MIRKFAPILASCALVVLAAAPAPAQTSSAASKDKTKSTDKSPSKTDSKSTSKADAKSDAKKPADKSSPTSAAAAKPQLVGSFGAWGVYTTAGKAPTCYVLAQPAKRDPADLKRDPGYIFISTRPAEHVRNEVSVAMGFEVKDEGAAGPHAMVGKTVFPMVAKGADLWLKEDGQDAVLLAAMKKGDKLTVEAASQRGKTTTDTFALAGLAQALDKVAKSCKTP